MKDSAPDFPKESPKGVETTSPLDDAEIEQLKQKLSAFLEDIYTERGVSATYMPAAGFVPTIKSIDDYKQILAQTAAEMTSWKGKLNNKGVEDTEFFRAEPEKFGEYTLQQETLGIDFENARVFIPDLSAFEGKPRFEVMKHLFDTYGQTHRIPGIEYWKWVIENPEKSHPKLPDDTKWYYFFGSTFRSTDGQVLVPRVLWYGSKWYPDGNWPEDRWLSIERVVLLEK